MSRTLDTILTWPLRRPRAILVITLFCIGLATVGALRLHGDASIEAMFSRDNPPARALSRVLNDFGVVDDLVVLVSLPGDKPATADDTEKLIRFGDDMVAKLRTDARTAKLVDGAFDQPDPSSRAFFERALAPAAVYYLDDATFAAAQERLTPHAMKEQLRADETMMQAPSAAGSLAKALMRDPLHLREFLTELGPRLSAQRPFSTAGDSDRFLSSDRRNLLILVRGTKPPSDLDFCRELREQVGKVAADANHDGLEIRLAGAYAIAAASAQAIRSDMIETVVGSVILLQLLFILAYRSPFKLFALSFGPIALGLLVGFAGYTLYTRGLTPLSAVLGGVLAGMAIDYSIQYLSMYERHRDMGESPGQSAEASAIGITPAAFAAFATSAIGFIAIGTSSVNALRGFAILGTLGLAGAFLAKMALLPLLLMLTDRRAASGPIRSNFRHPMMSLLRWIAAHSGWAMGISIAIFIAAAAFLAARPSELLPFEDDLSVMHPRPNAAFEAQRLIAERFGMHDWLVVDLQAASESELVSLAHRVDDRLQTPVARNSGIAGTFGLATLLPDPAQAARRSAELQQIDVNRVLADFHAAIRESAFNPDAPELKDAETAIKAVLTAPPPGMADLIRYRGLAEMLLPRSALLSNHPSVTETLTLVFIDGSTDKRASRDRAVDGLRAALADEKGATLTGISVLSHDSEQTVRHDLPRLSLVALGIVLLYLILHFRNVSEPVLSLLPTVFSLVVLLGAMRLAGEKVNMVNLVAAPLLIGIDVDYGVFLVALARVKRTQGETTDELIARIAPVCHAIIMCAAATVIGYGSLMWTSVPAIRSLGFAVAVGIGACLFSVLFLLAPIFLRLTRAKTERS